MEFLYTLTQLGFIATTFVFYGLLLTRLKKSLATTHFSPEKKRQVFNKALFALIFWGLVASVLSITGFLNNFSDLPPRLLIILLIPLTVIIFTVRTKTVQDILDQTPPEFLLRLQGFRIIVELLLLSLFRLRLIPVQMTFEGWNFDILSGLGGLVVAWLFATKKITRSAVIIYNYVGLALLLNIVVTALLSAPTPFRVFMQDPANTIVVKFPFVLLPGFLVPLAYGLHFLSLKQLHNKN